MDEVCTPNCPACGQPPTVVINRFQALCGDEYCRIFMWNPTQTLAFLLANEQPIDGPETEG